MIRCYSFSLAMVLGAMFLIGCAKSSPAPGGNSSASKSSTDSASDSGAKPTADGSVANGDKKAASGFWEDYPDVPKIEIMTEVDGIKIPRAPGSKQTLDLKAAIPADVGNENAKQKPSEPVTGDTLTIRFNSEPKVLNPITETSAVMQYINQYVMDVLARQNPETFEYEPGIASKWIIEDSVKLSADYPGRERRIAMNGGPAAATLTMDYVLPESKDGKPVEGPKVKITTSDNTGKAIGNVWVGIFPNGRISGASVTGYHEWSNDKGELEISGFPTGQYTIKTGDELFGAAKRSDDGSLVVTPATPENPLKEKLDLKSGEWQDVQRETIGTFYLREDAKWSDGAPFTTKDVEFGYALVNSQFVDGDSLRTYYSDLIECKAIGPLTVRLRYRQQYFKASEFMYQLAFISPPFHFFEQIFREQGRELTLDTLTVEQETSNKQISVRGQEFGKFFNTDERYNSKPLGAGPYIVDKWERKDRIELVRNSNFWDPPKAGHVDRIIVKFIPDQVTALAALRAGEIDFFYEMASEQYFDDWPTLDKETQDKYVRASWVSPQFQYVGWSELFGPFKDRRVRIALAMLFDQQEFINQKLNREAVVVTGTQYYFGPGYDHEVAPIKFDPDTARDLLTEAGWIDSDNDGILDRNGEKFQFVLRMPQGRSIYNQIAEVMQKNFKSVGIDMQIQIMEWASFIDKVRAKENDAYMARWAMPIESDPYQIWHSSEGARHKRGSNAISFQNQQADELIEQMRVAIDPQKRRRYHQSFHRLLDSEQPYLFMFMPNSFGAYHKRFRNVKWYRIRPGFDLSEWYVPKDEQLHK